jgi:carboxypeptidase Taq
MNTYQDYKDYGAKIMDVNAAIGLLSWDQETYMPDGSSDLRSRQIATLSGILHQMLTSADYHQLLLKLSDDDSLSSEQNRNVQLSVLDYNKKAKFSTEFVEEMSKSVSIAFQAWQAAKSKNDFSLFEKPLEDLVKLKFKEADIKGYEGHIYNAFVDDYEPGMTVEILDKVFIPVKEKLGPLVERILTKACNLKNFKNHYDTNTQWDFTIELLKKLGYNFNIGRQDRSSHPFSISFGPEDARITTRIDEKDLTESIWSTIHECGHAFYEMGLKMENYGIPAGEACSLSIHESQSRLWENMVGRSKAFWEYMFPILKSYFPEQLFNVSLNDFYFESNKVEKGLIRTNADEITYHFHVLIRYEIEKALFNQDITVKDLPNTWNELYKKYLGIDVPNNKMGILQDVHWSHGSFGYFPTYSLGSFYAAQFFETAKIQIPNLENHIASGNFNLLLDWLRKNIHQYGRIYNSEELCKKVSGEGLNFNFFYNYIDLKYKNLVKF